MKPWKNRDYWLALLAVLPVLIFLGIQFFTGYSPYDFVTFILFALAAGSLQLLAMDIFKARILRIMPLLLALILSARGTWFFLTSEAWMNATLGGLICDYCSPLIGTIIACFLPKE